MLIEFSVGNYRSYKETVTLSMVAAAIKSRPEELDINNVIEIDSNLKLLTSAAIYGANASGKSNLIAALHFMREFVLTSSRETQITQAIDVERFRLSSETDGEPSLFEVVFLLEGTRYRYGFEVTAERVNAEWLYTVPTTREARLFERELDDIKVNARLFKEGRGLEVRTRSNALFLSVVAQFNGDIAKKLLRWFANLRVSTGLSDIESMLLAMHQFENPRYKEDIVQFMKKLDVGIDDLIVERLPAASLSDVPSIMPDELKRAMELFLKSTADAERLIIQTVHKKYDADGRRVGDEKFDLQEHESEGTKKLFALAYPVLYALRNGQTLVVDEFDARLHPLITCEIIRLFSSKKTNPRSAQLIFTTHDTNLLSSRLFRRDQIWFVEKSRQGFSDLYSLVEYRIKERDTVDYRIRERGTMVRNDASFEKDYIEGRYGAIPFIGDFSGLMELPDA